MKIGRRDFMKAAIAMAEVLGLEASGLLKLQETLAAGGAPPVIWLQGQSCSGCSVSFLNTINMASVDDLLLNSISLEYHPTVMAAAGDLAISAASLVRPSIEELRGISSEWLGAEQNQNFDLNGDQQVNFKDYALLAERGYILIVEGAIPVGAGGEYCEIATGLTMLDGLDIFARKADVIIAVGTCAAHGGLPAAAPNPTNAMGVNDALKHLGLPENAINIPGCPIHPDWLVGAIISLLTGQAIPLDGEKRPLAYFGEKIHDEGNCPFKDDPKVFKLGEKGCLKDLGCKGPDTKADCYLRMWNSPGPGEDGVNWCIGAGSPCIGCTEKNFPDDKFSPFYTLAGIARNDGITVWRAKYKTLEQDLDVRATCDTQPGETLTVAGYGDMTWKANQKYYVYHTKPTPSPGETVTILSGSGGSVTVPVEIEN
jgi:hydrogenase small subunit